MIAKTAGLVIVLVVAAVGVALYLPTLGNPQSHKTTTTVTDSTSCTSSTVTSSSPAFLNGSFTAYSSSPVRIDSVKAAVYTGQDGVRTLQFDVGFTNVGNDSFYVVRGCGSSLTSTITSGGGVVKTVDSLTRCLCAEGPAAVNASQSQSAVDPGCWSGYYYEVRQPGSFSAQLTLSWSSAPESNSESGHVTIVASFTVP